MSRVFDRVGGVVERRVLHAVVFFGYALVDGVVTRLG